MNEERFTITDTAIGSNGESVTVYEVDGETVVIMAPDGVRTTSITPHERAALWHTLNEWADADDPDNWTWLHHDR